MHFDNSNIDVVKRTGSGKCHMELAMGNAGGNRYIPTKLILCLLSLLIVIANVILIGNRLLLSLKGMIRSDGHNLNPGCKDSCSRANNFCYAMLCSSKPLTITCCLHRRQGKASICTSYDFRQRQHYQF